MNEAGFNNSKVKRVVVGGSLLVVGALAVGVLGGVSAGAEHRVPAGYGYGYGGPVDCTGNQAPKASFNYTPVPPRAGETVTFQSSSTDPDDGPIQLESFWEFTGDGFIDRAGDRVTWSYDRPGDYHARLIVYDGCTTDLADVIVRVTGAAVSQPQDTQGPVIVISSRRNRVIVVNRRGRFTFFLGPFFEDVSGTIGFRSVDAFTGRKRKRRKSRINLGTKSVTVPAGKVRRVTVAMPKRARRILAKRKKIRMSARMTLRDKLGNASNRTYPFTLRAPAKAKKKRTRR